MTWKEYFNEGKDLFLATSSQESGPHANIVKSLGFVDGKLLIADCQMQTTIRNLRDDPACCIVGGYIRIKGTAELFASGNYFDLCVQKNKDYPVRTAILIEVREVFDLDKGETLS